MHPATENIRRASDRIAEAHRIYRQLVPLEYQQEYLEGGYWFASADNQRNYKLRPYDSWESLMSIQALGIDLFRTNVTGISIYEKLASYVIGTGHKYTASVRRDQSATDREIRLTQEAIEAVRGDDWQEVQEETLKRWLGTGEAFRYIEPLGDGIDWHFVDAHDVRPPGGKQAPFGIEYLDPEVQRIPTEYWVRGHSKPRLSDRSAMQHIKHGVDSLEPRGVPLLWMAWTLCKEIEALNSVETDAAIAYAHHTVVYGYGSEVNDTSMDLIADGLEKIMADRKERNQQDAVGIHHARDHEVQLLSASFSATGWVDLIQSKERRIASIACIPEFMVSGQADTGSRNTLISAEAPFTRRVERIGAKLASFDVDLMYMAAAVKLGFFGDAARMADFRRRVAITADVSLPDTQERWRREQSIMDQGDRGYLDFRTVVAKLGHDPDQVIDGLRSDAERRIELADDNVLTSTYTADELLTRTKAYQALLAAGWDEIEAAGAVGIDPPGVINDDTGIGDTAPGGEGEERPASDRDPGAPTDDREGGSGATGGRGASPGAG